MLHFTKNMKTAKHVLVLDSRIKWEENIQIKEIIYVTGDLHRMLKWC